MNDNATHVAVGLYGTIYRLKECRKLAIGDTAKIENGDHVEVTITIVAEKYINLPSCNGCIADNEPRLCESLCKAYGSCIGRDRPDKRDIIFKPTTVIAPGEPPSDSKSLLTKIDNFIKRIIG